MLAAELCYLDNVTLLHEGLPTLQNMLPAFGT